MTEIKYLDPLILEQVEALETAAQEQSFADVVDKALKQLPPDLEMVIIQTYWMGRSTQQIAETSGLSRKQVMANLYEAKRQLKALLADFARQRWNVSVTGLCRICNHPRRRLIEMMLRKKPLSEPWGSFNRRLERRIGERFGPPKVLAAHLNHMKARRGIKHENR